MTSAQVVETSVNVISNSPSQDYTHPDDRTLLYNINTIIIDFNYNVNNSPRSIAFPFEQLRNRMSQKDKPKRRPVYQRRATRNMILATFRQKHEKQRDQKF